MLVLGVVIAICLAAVGTWSASAAPKPAKLSMAAARSAATTKARGYNRQNRLISLVDFEGCHRTTAQKIHCGFHGSGQTGRVSGSCEIRVVVTGEGSHADAKLRATCRSERLPYLTFGRALPLIRRGGEELAQRGVTVILAERISDLEIEATVDWQRTTPLKEECEASFVARLVGSDQVVLTHEGPACSALSVMPTGPVRY